MQQAVRPVLAVGTLITLAVVVLLPALEYVDPYYIDYYRQCVLGQSCPNIDWAPPSVGYPVMPRQIKRCSVNGREFIVILRPSEKFDATCRSYIRYLHPLSPLPAWE